MSNIKENLETVNIYLIEDKLVQKATRALGDALKYLYETKNRDKYSGVNYYNAYIYWFCLLNENTPVKFENALAHKETDINEIVIEFLEAVSFYMLNKTSIKHKVTFLPFYFEKSFNNKLNYSKEEFGKYVRDVLIKENKCSPVEIIDSIIYGCHVT